MRNSITNLAIGLAILGLLVIGKAWMGRKKDTINPNSSGGHEGEPPLPGPLNPSPAKPEPPTDEPPPPPSSPAEGFVSKLESLVSKISDVELISLLKKIVDRIEEEGPDFGKETSTGFIEEMIDRLDEITSNFRNHDQKTQSALRSFQNVIISMISTCGAELIQSDIWDPSQQRAVAKEPTNGVQSPTFLRFGSTGFRRHGQLIRKQEVVIAIPQPIL
jgi:molecular chaperone GrpE (heat shock protein)